MCLGDQTSTQTAPQWLQDVSQGNLGVAQSMQATPYQNYTGQFVAPFSPEQRQSFGYGTNIANTTEQNLTPGAEALSTALQTAANAPTVQANSISSQMSPYMNQYVNLALQPQLAQAANAYMLQTQGQQGAATSAGAFGDPRANLLQSNLGLNYAMENQGLVGNAYNSAFNTAIGAGAQDVSNQLTAQNANAGIWSNQIGNLLAGSGVSFNQATSAANLENVFGGQQTAQQQQLLTDLYNQYQISQQYPFLTSQNVNASIGAATPLNTTLTQPNNALWGILGAAAGGVGMGLTGGLTKSDENAKTDIKKVGELSDGLNVYSFRYKEDDPKVRHIGLIAQEVQRKYPKAGAVVEVGGTKFVDYARALKPAADAFAFGIAA
jgi:hypothetical protein